MTGTPSPGDRARAGGSLRLTTAHGARAGGVTTAPAWHRRGCCGKRVTTKRSRGRGAASVLPGGARSRSGAARAFARPLSASRAGGTQTEAMPVPCPAGAGSWQGAVSERRHHVRDQALLRDVESRYHGPSLGGAKWDSGAEGASCRTGAGDGGNGQGVTERPRRAAALPVAAALGVREALTSN